MKVLLVYANPYLVPTASPYGLEILHKALIRTGAQVTIYCPFMYSDHPYDHAAHRIRQLRPDIVGISIRNLDDCTAAPSALSPGFKMGSYISVLQRLINSLREAYPSTTFVLGGAGFSFCSDLLMTELKIDYGFVGPGEKGFPLLIDLSERYGSVETIPTDLLQRVPNIVFNRGGVIQSGGVSYRMQDENTLRSLKYSPGFSRIERFTKGYIPVRAKIGCSLRCSYCVVPVGENLSIRAADSVIDELRELVANAEGFTRVFFADSEFNLPTLDHPTKILRKIIQSHLNEHLQWVAYFTVKPFSDRFVRLLKESNCTGISLTIDSFSDQVLPKIGKDFGQRDAIELLDKLVEVNIPTTVNIIIGLPGEKEDTIEETLKWIREYALTGVQFSLTVGARVYPNTPLANYAQTNHSRHVYGDMKDNLLTPALYCEPSSPSVICKTLLERLGHLPSVNVMHLNGPYRYARMYKQEKNALTRGYYFWGEGNHSEAIKWFRKAARTSGPYRIDALWALALISEEKENQIWYKRYLSEILKYECQWPDQIDYDGVRQILEV